MGSWRAENSESSRNCDIRCGRPRVVSKFFAGKGDAGMAGWGELRSYGWRCGEGCTVIDRSVGVFTSRDSEP